METEGVLCEVTAGLLCATEIHIMLDRPKFSVCLFYGPRMGVIKVFPRVFYYLDIFVQFLMVHRNVTLKFYFILLETSPASTFPDYINRNIFFFFVKYITGVVRSNYILVPQLLK